MNTAVTEQYPAIDYPGTHRAIDLFSRLALPPFPIELLPKAVADFASDQAELIGVDPAVIGMTAIGAAAACIDDRVQIQPKRHDPTWRESPRLWIAVIGDPSAKKSPGINKALGPLFRIDDEWRKESSELIADWEKQCGDLDKDAEKPPQPKQKRLIVNDVTVEKLGMILSTTEARGILSVQDELSGWLAGMDAYKNGAGGKDKAAWLEAYNGGPKCFDRVSRDSAFVENWSVGVVGGIQPSVVQAYASSVNHDGMLQRFVLVYANECTLGQDRVPNMRAKEAYDAMLRQLTSTQPPPNDEAVKLSEEAHQAREDLDVKLLQAVRSIPNKFLTAALGKWGGLFARLLLTFHCIECASEQRYPTSRPVSGDTARRVSSLMVGTLLPHALRFYQGIDPAEDHATELAALLLAKGWCRFTVKRDINRHLKSFRRLKPWETDETLDRLEAYGWIHPEAGKLSERARPSAYLVNPDVHARFTEQAAQERQRRADAAEIIATMRH
jgi:hypothetical protein